MIKNELGEFKYKNLVQVMKSILCIPHSNAGCERVFSLVRKNHTDYRGTMGIKTLESLLINKMDIISSDKPCFMQNFSPELLKKAKSATYVSLNS